MKIKEIIWRLANCAVLNQPNIHLQNKERGCDKNEEQISSRCRNVIKYMTRGPITQEKLIEGLHIPKPPFQHLVEDEGLGHIFRGYESIQNVELVRQLSFKSSDSESRFM